MFRWAHFTRWQGEPFPAYLRRTDRLPQAESLGIACFPRLTCVSVSLYLCQVSTLRYGGLLTSARVSNRGHQAAELGCGRLRRCPVIRPATGRGMRDTPYDRCRTLTAAYRAGACLSLDDFPAVSSQRLLQNFFLICAEATSVPFSFPAVSRRWQVPRKKVSKNAGRIFLPFRPLTILPAFAVLFNSDDRPFFGRRILTYFGFLVRAKSC